MDKNHHMRTPQMYEIANDHTNKGVKRVLPKQNYNENNLAELQKVYTLQKEIARVLDQTAATKIQSMSRAMRNRQRFKALRHAAVGQSVQRIPSVISASPRATGSRRSRRSVRSKGARTVPASVSPKDRKTIQHSPKKRGLDNASPQSIKRRRKQAPSMEAKKKGDRSSRRARKRKILRAKARVNAKAAETRIVPAPVSSDARRSPHTLQSRQVVASNLRDLLGLSPNASMSNVLHKKKQLSLTFHPKAGPSKPPKPTSQSTSRNAKTRANAEKAAVAARSKANAEASNIISHALQAISKSPNNKKKQLNHFYELLGFPNEKGARSRHAFYQASLVLHPNKLRQYTTEDKTDVLEKFYTEMVADPKRSADTGTQSGGFADGSGFWHSTAFSYTRVPHFSFEMDANALEARKQSARRHNDHALRKEEERKEKEEFIKGKTELNKELSDLRNQILNLQKNIDDAVERESHWLAIRGKKLESNNHRLSRNLKKVQKDYLMNQFVRKFEIFNKKAKAKAARTIQSALTRRHAQKTRELEEEELKKLKKQILNGQVDLNSYSKALIKSLNSESQDGDKKLEMVKNNRIRKLLGNKQFRRNYENYEMSKRSRISNFMSTLSKLFG
jgi:hypothetical protein